MTLLSKGGATSLQGQADRKPGNIRNVAMNEGVSIVVITEAYDLPDQAGVNTGYPFTRSHHTMFAMQRWPPVQRFRYAGLWALAGCL